MMQSIKGNKESQGIYGIQAGIGQNPENIPVFNIPPGEREKIPVKKNK